MRAFVLACVVLAACRFDSEGNAFFGGPGADGGGPDAAPADLMHHLFSAGIGAMEVDEVRDVARFADGDVALVGMVWGDVDFGAGPVTGHGNRDAFVARLSPIGTLRWVRVMGVNDLDSAERVVVTSDGDVIAAGRFHFSPDLGLGPVAGNGGSDTFVARYRGSDGSPVWVSTVSGSQEDVPAALSLGPGVVLLGGTFRASALVAGTLTLTGQGDDDGYVAALDLASGAAKWATVLCGPMRDAVTGVASFADGRVAVGGFFDGSIDLGFGAVASKGQSDMFLTELDASGAPSWAKTFGGTGAELVADVAVEGDTILATGAYTGAISIGGAPLAAVEGFEPFVASYDAGGSLIWAVTWPGPKNGVVTSIASFQPGVLAVAGEFDGTLSILGPAMTSRGSKDVFIATLTTGGIVEQALQIGGSGDDRVGAIAGGAGELSIGGSGTAAVDAGGGPLPYQGKTDGFWARFGE